MTAPKAQGPEPRQLATSTAAGKSAATDPELERLLGTIRRRRLQQLSRERAFGAAAPAGPSRGHGEGGVVLQVRASGPSVRMLRIARPAGFAFTAGQAVKLGLPGVPVRRRYSIASSPADEALEFCVEAVPGGRFSSRLFALAPGDRVLLGKPGGAFALRTDRRKHVMVATSTGIAPLRSMLHGALASVASGTDAAPAEFWILHGASHADELPYAEELAALARDDARVTYLPTVSRAEEPRNRGWTGQRGRVDALLAPLLERLGPKQELAVYACGHPEMVRGVRDRFEPLGYLVLEEAFD